MRHVWAIEHLAGGTNYSRSNVEADDFMDALRIATEKFRIEPANLIALWCVDSSVTSPETLVSLRNSVLHQAERIVEARRILGQPQVRVGWFWKVLGKILGIS